MNHCTNRTLFLVLGTTPKSRTKVCAQWRILKPPVTCWLCVSFRISYSIVKYVYVSFSGFITSVGEELSLTCNSKRFPLLLSAWDRLRL